MNNLYLCGFIGNTRNDIANHVAKILKYRLICLDYLIQKQTKMTTKDILKQYGENRLREIESEIFQKVSNMHSVVVIVTPTTFAVEENIVLAKQSGKIIYLNYPYRAYFRKLKASAYRGKETFLKEQECRARYNKVHTLYKIAASETFDAAFCPQLQAKAIARLMQED